jgi:hypothetical protein
MSGIAFILVSLDSEVILQTVFEEIESLLQDSIDVNAGAVSRCGCIHHHYRCRTDRNLQLVKFIS